jgi:parallel beta-helix repeat protein
MSTIAIRINTLLLVLILLTGLVLVAMSATRAIGGPLDPPAPPASTDGVREPGMPVSSIPFSATVPGRYYLTRDLTIASASSGVTIFANDVTLDLNGFTLHGIAGSINGVLISGAHSGIAIMNGNIRGWFNGIDASNGSFTRISNVGVFDGGISPNDGSYGILAGPYSIIEDCRVSNNKAIGIRAENSTVRGCTLTNNGNEGIRAAGGALLYNNLLRGNSPTGATLGYFTDVSFYGFDNYASENSLGRIYFDIIDGGSRSLLERNSYCGVDGDPNLSLFWVAPDLPEFNWSRVNCT